MKRTISIALIAVLLLSGLFILTGCEDNKNNDADKYQKYEIEAKYGKLEVELPKDSGYELKLESNKGTFYNESNKSTIELFLMDTSLNSIIMKEKDFSPTAYHDYKEVEIAGHKAYTIINGNNFRYEWGILLDEYDKEHGKYHGVKIKVSKSSLDSEGLFKPEEFVKTEGFEHFLNSIKLTLN